MEIWYSSEITYRELSKSAPSNPSPRRRFQCLSDRNNDRNGESSPKSSSEMRYGWRRSAATSPKWPVISASTRAYCPAGRGNSKRRRSVPSHGQGNPQDPELVQLKREMARRWSFATQEETRSAVFEGIAVWYPTAINFCNIESNSGGSTILMPWKLPKSSRSLSW